MVMNEKVKRTKVLQVRLSVHEFDTINNRFSKTTCRKISEYSRKILLGKTVTFFSRNQSLDEFMEEMILLRRELHYIGHNFNQAVRKLHTLDACSQFERWVLFQESMQSRLLDKVGAIQEKISKISDQWLQ
jgi:MobC-like protein